jgi:urease accessory protein
MLYRLIRHAGFATLVFGSGAAYAHTGHGTSGIVDGLAHPFGLDHLLAMVAVGVWSVSTLPANKSWWGPATFMSALMASAVLGASGFSLPYLETLIAASVVLFGAMLAISRVQLPPNFGLLLIAVAASLHGLAHGAESPETGFLAYAIGFLFTTASLHLGGVMLGLGVKRYFAQRASITVQLLGVGCGGAGIFLLSQI